MKDMQDTQFMTAQEKVMVLKQWESFLKGELSESRFTKRLYDHLIQHCSFIAHYSRAGFYEEYFRHGGDTARFLSQFDNRDGVPSSIEYGGLSWYTDSRYNDINSAMCQVGSKYIPRLMQYACAAQRNTDITQAKSLLAKHGLTMGEDR